MMKKSLCVVFVLAMVAQICARPADEKVDPENKVEDEIVTGDKDAKDKGKDVDDKATKAAKGIVDRKKKDDTDAVKDGEEHAFKKHGHGEDCHKPGSKGPHGDGGIISGPLKKAVKFGEELVKRGEDVFEKIFQTMG